MYFLWNALVKALMDGKWMAAAVILLILLVICIKDKHLNQELGIFLILILGTCLGALLVHQYSIHVSILQWATEDEMASLVRRVEENQKYLKAALVLADNHVVTIPSQKIADTIDVVNQLFTQYEHCMKNTKHKYKDLMKEYEALMKKTHRN